MKKFYRNKKDLIVHGGMLVEAGSLFELDGTKLILVDKDYYVSVPFDEDSFEFAFESEMV